MKKYICSVFMTFFLLSCDKFNDLFPHPSHETTAGALSFDGVNDDVRLGDWFRYQVFTVQFWAKPGTTQNTYANIIDNEHASFVSWVIQQDIDKTNEYYMGAGALVYFKLQANVWQQVTAVKSKTSLSVYVNGELIDSAPLVSDITYLSSHTLRLGQWAGGERAWNGQLDEVRLWNKSLSKAEIQNNMNCQLTGSEKGLVGYYRFNQGVINSDNNTVTTLTDLSGNNHNGILENFSLTGSNSNWVEGKVTGTCH